MEFTYKYREHKLIFLQFKQKSIRAHVEVAMHCKFKHQYKKNTIIKRQKPVSNSTATRPQKKLRTKQEQRKSCVAINMKKSDTFDFPPLP